MGAAKIVNEYGDGVAWVRGSEIGKGGFGRVYVANRRSKQSCLPSLMAVKSAEVSISGSIQKEMEILSNLRGCPHIIKCFGEETTVGNNGFMVYNVLLEYGSGGTLADRIKTSGATGLPELEARVYARSILRGLRHIHGKGYVHCDLKPENVLLVRNGGGTREGITTEFVAKIGDFGLAKRKREHCISKKRKLEPYWRGTPMYFSPEVLSENVQEAPSDIWAFGCIVLEMLTGKPLWEANQETFNAEDVLRKIGAGHELPKIPSELSKEARDFLKGCLVRKTMYRLTVEMLLNHPFMEGLGDDDCSEDTGKVEDFNELESILLVCESSDDEYDYEDEFEGDTEFHWSEEDDEYFSITDEVKEFGDEIDQGRGSAIIPSSSPSNSNEMPNHIPPQPFLQKSRRVFG